MNHRQFEALEKRIQIRPETEDRLAVHLPYSPELVAKIKTIPGRNWNPARKYWSVPGANGAVQKLLALFAGEKVELDPTLRAARPESTRQKSMSQDLQAIALMTEELKLRNYGAKTRKNYLGHVDRFIRFFGKDARSLDERQVREYLLHLIDEDGVSYSYINQCISALKFLYEKTLHHSMPIANIPRPRKERKLPRVLSREEVLGFLKAVENPKHRAIMLLTYSGGLRLGEVVRLRVEDIDKDRKMIHIRKHRVR